MVMLEIYCSLQQWKNFANPSRIDKVIAMVRVAPFFLNHGVEVRYLTNMAKVKGNKAVHFIVYKWVNSYSTAEVEDTAWLASRRRYATDGHQARTAVTTCRRQLRHARHCSLHVILRRLLQRQSTAYSLAKPSHQQVVPNLLAEYRGPKLIPY